MMNFYEFAVGRENCDVVVSKPNKLIHEGTERHDLTGIELVRLISRKPIEDDGTGTGPVRQYGAVAQPVPRRGTGYPLPKQSLAETKIQIGMYGPRRSVPKLIVGQALASRVADKMVRFEDPHLGSLVWRGSFAGNSPLTSVPIFSRRITGALNCRRLGADRREVEMIGIVKFF